MAEFERLKKLNRDILRAPAQLSNQAAKPAAAKRKRGKR
jgi:hypothetical protein